MPLLTEAAADVDRLDCSAATSCGVHSNCMMQKKKNERNSN